METLYTMRRPDRERSAPPVVIRRTAAVVAVLAYPVLTLGGDADLTWLRDATGPMGYGLLVAVLVLIWIASFVVITSFRRRLAQAPDHQLDERERAARDEAHVISHRILGSIIAVGTAWTLVVAPFFGMDREVSLDVVLSAGFSLLIISVALPSAVVAWRDTDVDDDDAEDQAPAKTTHVAGRVS